MEAYSLRHWDLVQLQGLRCLSSTMISFFTTMGASGLTEGVMTDSGCTLLCVTTLALICGYITEQADSSYEVRDYVYHGQGSRSSYMVLA